MRFVFPSHFVIVIVVVIIHNNDNHNNIIIITLSMHRYMRSLCGYSKYAVRARLSRGWLSRCPVVWRTFGIYALNVHTLMKIYRITLSVAIIQSKIFPTQRRNLLSHERLLFISNLKCLKYLISSVRFFPIWNPLVNRILDINKNKKSCS